VKSNCSNCKTVHRNSECLRFMGSGAYAFVFLRQKQFQRSIFHPSPIDVRSASSPVYPSGSRRKSNVNWCACLTLCIQYIWSVTSCWSSVIRGSPAVIRTLYSRRSAIDNANTTAERDQAAFCVATNDVLARSVPRSTKIVRLLSLWVFVVLVYVMTPFGSD
jgi:hypothetical protein